MFSIIDNPFEKKEVLFSFLFSAARLIICFIFSYLIISLLILVEFAPKDKISKSYMGPILNFIKRYGRFAFLILLLISLYRIADIVMGVMANVFYLEKQLRCTKKLSKVKL